MKPGQNFAYLPMLAAHLRGELESKKAVLLYAYNGTGKTRLSMTMATPNFEMVEFGYRGQLRCGCTGGRTSGKA